MQAFYGDHFDLLLPQGHRFPMAKYRMLRKALAQQLLVARAALLQAMQRICPVVRTTPMRTKVAVCFIRFNRRL
jgi:hypothetical protein